MEHSSDIEAAARRLRIGVLVATALAGALCLLALVVTVALPGARDGLAIDVGAEPLAPWAAAVVLALTGFPMILALWRLSLMLRNVERGEIFTQGTIGELKAFALFVLIGALTSILAPPLVALASAALDAAPTGKVTIMFDSTDFSVLVVSLLLFFVARLLVEAQRIADEHRQIV